VVEKEMRGAGYKLSGRYDFTKAEWRRLLPDLYSEVPVAE
jgi:hypothetical protein